MRRLVLEDGIVKVFANCREIGTYLNNKMSEIYGSASFIRKERWGRAYANFSKFASLDLHLEDISRGNSKYSKDEITVNKSDTEYLLTQTQVKKLSEARRCMNI